MKGLKELVTVISLCLPLFANAGECKRLNSDKSKLNALIKQIEADKTLDPKVAQLLTGNQKVWLEYANSQLKLMYPDDDLQLEYGTVYPECACSELVRLYEIRIKELSRWTHPEPEGEVCTGSLPTGSR